MVALFLEFVFLLFHRIQEEREERHRMKRVIRGQGDPGGGIAQFPEEDRKSRFEPEVDLMPGNK